MSDKQAILRAARRYGSNPKFDRMAREKYHVSGTALLTKLAKGESGFSMKAVSKAGARGATQFMPATRDDFIKKYGVDAWRDPDSAVHAAKIYLQKSGLAAYNPGMKSYSDYILGQKVGDVGKSTHVDSSDVSMSGGTMKFDAEQTGGQDVPSRKQSIVMALQSHSGKLPKLGANSTLKEADYLFRTGQATERVPGSYSSKITTTPSKVSFQDSGRSGAHETGHFKITGPHPDRVAPEVKSFGRKVASQFGEGLVAKDGSTHSKFTVNGNISDHWDGHAVDIYELADGTPMRGTTLVLAGQAALIAAGMPAKEARKQHGGLFNINGHQVIFNTQEGGDHTTHLHISARKRR